MADSFSMQDKSIVITGASRGIGRGLARYFAEQGAKVAAIARNMDQLHELQDEITSSGGKCRVYQLDLRDVAAIPSVFAGIVEDFGQLDILINNAGMGKPIPALDISEADWDEMMSLNLKASFFYAQAAAKHMLP